jgi:hypothetical protein
MWENPAGGAVNRISTALTADDWLRVTSRLRRR